MNYHPQHKRPHLELVPTSKKPKVEKNPKVHSKLRRPKNIEVRSREYLRPDEVERLVFAAKSVGRYPLRDGLMILMMFRHGLRVTELIRLRWDDVDWRENHIYIRRIKRGKDSNQFIEGKELRLLRQHKREQEEFFGSKEQFLKTAWIFMSERKTPLTDEAVRQIVKRAGEKAGFDFPVHPHMMRHACGYYLAGKGYDTRLIQDYLGHCNINHTVIYTELAPGRFNRLWE